MDELKKQQSEILEQLKQLNILTRVNNILMSKMILQMQVVKRELHLPKLVPFTKFEILDDDYQELIKEYGRKDVDKALYFLDRQLQKNKLNCPHNIKRYITNRLKKLAKSKQLREEKEKELNEENSQ